MPVMVIWCLCWVISVVDALWSNHCLLHVPEASGMGGRLSSPCYGRVSDSLGELSNGSGLPVAEGAGGPSVVA